MGKKGRLMSGTTCRGLTEAGPVLRWTCGGRDPVRCSASRLRVTGLLTGGGAQRGAYPEALGGLSVLMQVSHGLRAPPTRRTARPLSPSIPVVVIATCDLTGTCVLARMPGCGQNGPGTPPAQQAPYFLHEAQPVAPGVPVLPSWNSGSGAWSPPEVHWAGPFGQFTDEKTKEPPPRRKRSLKDPVPLTGALPSVSTARQTVTLRGDSAVTS